MATILDSFDFGPDKTQQAKLPWDLWMDGRIHQIGADDCRGKNVGTIRAVMGSVAKKRGLKIRHKIDREAGTLTFQAYKDETPAPTADPAPVAETPEPTPEPVQEAPDPAPVAPALEADGPQAMKELFPIGGAAEVGQPRPRRKGK